MIRGSALALGVLVVWPAVAAASSASTLVVTPRPVSTFAYEGATIGWATRPCNFGSGIARFHVQNLVTGRTLRFTSHGLGCGIVEAVTDHRVINDAANEATFDWLETATLNRRRLVRVQLFDYRFAPGTMHGAVVSDGRTFVYPWWKFDFQDPTACLNSGTHCDLIVTGGGLKTLRGPPPATALPGAPPAKRVSVSGGLVALQPYLLRSRFATGNVQVRSAKTGAFVSSFPTNGDVVGLALHSTLLAVMVRGQHGGKHVEFRSALTGALRSSFSLSRTAGFQIDLSGAGLVFRAGRDIRLLDPSDGSRRTIHAGTRRPVAWRIEGRRVIWVVDRDHRGFIMTSVVP